jgi:hypothetical protein
MLGRMSPPAPPSPLSLAIVAFLAGASLAAPALAAEEAPSPGSAAPPVPEPLLFAPGHDASSAARTALGRPSPAIALDEILADPSSPARLFGTSEQHACAGGSFDPATLPALLAAADETLVQLETDRAYGLLARTAENLPCASGFVDTEPLSRLFFLLGLAASYSGDGELATRWFAQSLAVDPSRRFDRDQAPAVYEEYLAAMERHYGSRPVPLLLLRRAEEPVELVLDGSRLDPERMPELGEGFHFLQFRRSAGDRAPATFQFRVDAEDRPVLATPGGLVDAAADGPRVAPEYAAAVAEALRAALLARGAASAQLVAGRSAFRFDGASGRFRTLREPVTRIEKARRFGRSATVLGLAMFGSGIAISVASAASAQGLHPSQPEYQGPYTANVLSRFVTVLGGTITVVGLPLLIGTQPGVAAIQPPRAPAQPPRRGAKSSKSKENQ